jgi:hypothetical protein
MVEPSIICSKPGSKPPYKDSFVGFKQIWYSSPSTEEERSDLLKKSSFLSTSVPLPPIAEQEEDPYKRIFDRAEKYLSLGRDQDEIIRGMHDPYFMGGRGGTYLVDGAVVTLFKREEPIDVSFPIRPDYAVRIIANTRERLNSVAETFGLPVDSLDAELTETV